MTGTGNYFLTPKEKYCAWIRPRSVDLVQFNSNYPAMNFTEEEIVRRIIRISSSTLDNVWKGISYDKLTTSLKNIFQNGGLEEIAQETRDDPTCFNKTLNLMMLQDKIHLNDEGFIVPQEKLIEMLSKYKQ